MLKCRNGCTYYVNAGNGPTFAKSERCGHPGSGPRIIHAPLVKHVQIGDETVPSFCPLPSGPARTTFRAAQEVEAEIQPQFWVTGWYVRPSRHHSDRHWIACDYAPGHTMPGENVFAYRVEAKQIKVKQ
jgi:hypothetical protein